MKFANMLALFAAITGTSALAMEKRNTPVRKVIVDVTTGISDLYECVKAFDGDMDPVVRASDRLCEIIQHGQEVTDRAEAIELSDSYSLAEPVKALDSKAKMLFKTLMHKTNEVRSVRACAKTREKLTTISKLSFKLIDTIVDKQVAPIARGASKRITEAMKKKFRILLEAYNQQNCPV
ncbi:hypothetical protein E4U53_004430 [Claviceps sorghi]|nr:hypothetical protein E4U53_004430 [Claviceps sorghi]